MSCRLYWLFNTALGSINPSQQFTCCLIGYSFWLQRLLIVPPELAYGSKGVQEIPPNAIIEVTCFYILSFLSGC